MTENLNHTRYFMKRSEYFYTITSGKLFPGKLRRKKKHCKISTLFASARKLKTLHCFFSPTPRTGPFTQLVWSDTRELGVGKARSRSGRTIVVANYQPRGNVNGQYVDNVRMNQYFLPANRKKLQDAVSGKAARASCSRGSAKRRETSTTPNG